MALRDSSMALLDLSAEAWALIASSVAARASDISFMMITLSFSILLFIFPRASICSLISAVASACFLLRLARMDSCWMLAASTSFLSFCTSASLFVELHLSSGGSAGLGEPVAQLVDLPGHVRPLPLSLGSGLPFSLKLLLHCFNTTLDLLDSLLGLGNQVLLIIQLSGKLSIVLFLVANNNLKIPLGSLKVSNRVLSHLQLALNLPLLLLKRSSSLLFFVQASLELTESRLQLRLNRRQMSNFFIGSDHVIVRLGLSLTNVLLLLVQLVDHFILLGDLILEHLDGVVTVALLQLDLGDGEFDVLDLFFDHANGSAVGLDLSCQSDPGRLLLAEDSLLLGKLCLSLCLEGRGLGLPVRVDRDAALLLLQLLSHGLDVLLETIQTSLKGLGHVKSLLVLAVARVGLFLELPELVLRVWQANGGPGLLDDDEPAPVPAGQVLPKVPLANLDQFPLVELLLVDLAPNPLEDHSLHQPDPLDHQFVPRLFHRTQGPGTEEHHPVAEPVPLTVERNAVHEGPDGCFVVGGGLDGLLAEAGVPHLEVGVEHPVGESSHADPDALEHTVTGQLVHDQRGLHLSGLLVGVGHQATHEVGLAGVQGRHQLHQGHQVHRGDGLAATLLLLLALLLRVLG